MSTDESPLVNNADDNEKVKPAYRKLEENDPALACKMCQRCVKDTFKYGEVYVIDDVVCHYFCLLFSSSLAQRGQDHEGILGFLPKDIWKEYRRGSRLRCSYCRKSGATIGCSVKSCKKTFHFPCGLENNSLHQFFDNFKSFCSTHRPHQIVDARCIEAAGAEEDALICPICYDTVSNKVCFETLWAPCCRKRWFHRTCVQRQALSQGYFFKCPLCNNNNKFNREMQEYGIYIPEMDAAWEREPNAFQDLYHIHQNCDAHSCKCPDGRAYSQKTGSWRLLTCNSCGAQGTHIVCCGLKINVASSAWRCSWCSDVIRKANLEPDVSHCLGPTEPIPASSTFSSSLSVETIPSKRRPADCSEASQIIKRRRSSCLATEKLGTSSSEAGSLQPCSSNLVKSEEKLSEPNVFTSHTESSDDEVIVVDSDSDVEVVEVHVKPTSQLSIPQSSNKELMTKDGHKIKVHKVIAGDGMVREEVGNLGVVITNHPVITPEIKMKTEEASSTDCSAKSCSHHENQQIVPSTSRDSSGSLTSGSPVQLQGKSSQRASSSSQNSSHSTASELKIDHARESNSSSRTGGATAGASSGTGAEALLPSRTQAGPMINVPNPYIPHQQLLLIPTLMPGGEPALQPFVISSQPMMLPQFPSQQANHQGPLISVDPRKSPDIVVLD